MTILCYGDSNTYGTPPMERLGVSGRYAPEVRWPGVLRAALGRPVIEAGLPGRTTCHDDPIEGRYRNGLSVLPAILHSSTPLDLMILKLGTNDAKQRFSLTGFDIALGVGALIQRARADLPDLPILVICPAPVKERGCLAPIFAGAEARMARLSSDMARIAKSHGTHYLDASAIIETDPLDGVHYSAEAHKTLGIAVADKIKETGL
ncbi:SGNH/GDSL hydrolase family protein [Mesobacterium pallidum]|uniref:SGNH/GDSL hydrolase family protein n=1 Tax=Mesobacterium pallidum TaxID=2872037 RepID=UPI001EE35E16|nr:SGNH/GDSL hydrolase family protein [Mesobacterium pallidum]